jgi:hypothetical protein
VGEGAVLFAKPLLLLLGLACLAIGGVGMRIVRLASRCPATRSTSLGAASNRAAGLIHSEPLISAPLTTRHCPVMGIEFRSLSSKLWNYIDHVRNSARSKEPP